MTIQLAVFLSSVAGAILFFVGGYWAARPASREFHVLRGQVDSYRNRLVEAEGERARVADLEEENQQLREERDTLNASASQALNGLRGEITSYQNRLAEAERERARIANLEKEIQQLNDERKSLAIENRQLHEKWKEKTRQAGALWDEKSDLKHRLEQTLEDSRLLKEQTERLENLEAERKQSAIKLETMGRQVASLEHYKEESARLSTLIAEVPHLHSTIDQLKQENRELRSLGLVNQPPAAIIRTLPAEHVGGSVQQLLEQFSENTGARGAALADDHGLLIAGTSEYAEGLAISGALVDRLMTQIADILPLGSLRQLVMVDANALTAAIHPFRFGSDRLMLASLSVGPGPDGQAVADLVNQASQLIGGVRTDKPESVAKERASHGILE